MRYLEKCLVIHFLLISWNGFAVVSANGQEQLPAFWIEDDLNRAFVQSEQKGKPLLILFRCPP